MISAGQRLLPVREMVLKAAENPDAQLGRDFVLLEMEADMTWITPVVPSYDNKNFDTPENAEKYLGNTGKCKYSYQVSDTPIQICFGVLQKE